MYAARPAFSWGHAGGRRDGHGRSPPTASLLTIRALPSFVLFVAAAAVLPLAAVAQGVPDATGAVTGIVTGDDAGALAGAEVTIAGKSMGTVTTGDGYFRITGVPHGAVVLEFRLMGYRSASFNLEIVGGTTQTLDVHLEIEPVGLEPLEVRARPALSPQLQRFYERRERGAGHYFTRDDINRMQSRQVTDLLRRVPGVRIEPQSGAMGTNYVVRMQRVSGISGGRPCPVLYFVNGMVFPLARDMGINQYIRPDEIAGMEVYSGASRLPSEFHVSPRDARCGVIVIWTRDGERANR
jgi:hypothetical protein